MDEDFVQGVSGYGKTHQLAIVQNRQAHVHHFKALPIGLRHIGASAVAWPALALRYGAGLHHFRHLKHRAHMAKHGRTKWRVHL